jgi:EmrB/QacA subfamily drug resistance transporter
MVKGHQPNQVRAAPDHESNPQMGADHPRLVLATTMLASSLAFVDGSVVNVGLPAIDRSFHASAGDLQWVINAYLLPLSALLLLGGAAGDRMGRRPLLIVGIGIFAAFSIGCAVAGSLPQFLLCRGLQGVGAAILLPNSLAILGASFSGEARGRAIGIWAATGAAVGAVGPVLGGWLIDTVGWRAIFLLNIPLAAIAIGLAVCFVRNAPTDNPDRSLDILGAVLATAGLAGLTWGLTVGSGSEGWTSAALIAVSAGAVLMLAFIWAEKRAGEHAMMPLVLFSASTSVGLTLLTLFLYGALGGLFVLIPYILIEAASYSGTEAGAALLPLPAVLALTSPLMGGLAGRIGSRLPLSVGPVVVAVGFVLLLRVDQHNSYWTTTFPAILLIAVGMAGAVAPLTTAVLASVGPRYTGSASGFNSAVARLGGLIATALLGGVLAAEGGNLIGQFHVAAIAGAGLALASSASAFLLIPAGRAA